MPLSREAHFSLDMIGSAAAPSLPHGYGSHESAAMAQGGGAASGSASRKREAPVDEVSLDRRVANACVSDGPRAAKRVELEQTSGVRRTACTTAGLAR